MFDIGLGEIAIILVIALLVFGPDRLPAMAKQAASFIRDLRAMVAKARQDLSDSVDDLGIDSKDLKELADLRNPNSYVRSKLLGGEFDDLGLDEFKEEFEDRKAARTTTATRKKTSTSKKSSTNGAAKPATTEPADSTPAPVTVPPFDSEAT